MTPDAKPSTPYGTRTLSDDAPASSAPSPEPSPPPGASPPPYGTVASSGSGAATRPNWDATQPSDGTIPPSGGVPPSYGPPPFYGPPPGSAPPPYGPPPYYGSPPNYGPQPNYQGAPYGPPPGYNPHSPGYQPRPLSQQEERTWGMIAHLSSLSGHIGVPFGHVLGPLIILLTRGKESEVVAREARHALNFNITMVICLLISLPLCLVMVGFFLFPTILLLQFICTILASIAANNGQEYRYPLSIEFVK